MTNGVDNRVLTATGTDAMNAEANLTFDGSMLSLTGRSLIAGGDAIGNPSLTITHSDADKIALDTPENQVFLTTYYEFPGSFTTNLMNSRKFLQISVGVSTQYDDRVMANVEAHQLALRSEILGTMSEFTEESIQGKAGRQALAASLQDAINSKLELLENFGGIDEVHFTSFVLQ